MKDRQDNLDIGAMYVHEYDFIYFTPYLFEKLMRDDLESSIVKLYGVIAHEMRHAWQSKTNRDKCFNNYKRGDIFHISEINAYAFQEAVMQTLIDDKRKFIVGVDDSVHILSKQLFEEYKDKLLNTIKKAI